MGMGSIRRDDPLVRVAFPASLAIHLAIAALIPAIVVVQSSGPAIETISFAHVISVSAPTPHPERAPLAAAPSRAAIPNVARTTPAPHARRASRRPETHATSAARSAAPMVAAEHAGSAVATPADHALPSAAASPPAQTTSVASTESRQKTGGYLPLGAEQPDPVLDPTVLQRLSALAVHVKLLVTVDESGRTKRVAFVPPLDDATEARIRAMLASASWDPAVCGAGVPCEGTATISL